MEKARAWKRARSVWSVPFGFQGVSGVLVGEAVRGLGPRANPDIMRLAHQVVVVDAFAALAGTHVGQDLGKPAHGRGVDERGTRGVVRGAPDGDSKCGTPVMVESTAANAAGGDFGNMFGHGSSWLGSTGFQFSGNDPAWNQSYAGFPGFHPQD